MHSSGTLEGQGRPGLVVGGMGRVLFALADAAEESERSSHGSAVAAVVPGEGVRLDPER